MTDSSTAPSASSPLRVGFLGPVGTFTEQAMLREPDLASAEHVAFPVMTEVLFAAAEGSIDLGVVPVENAIEGTVNASVDTMAFDVDVLVQRELLEPVSMNLLVRPGTRLADVRRVVSIPVATAQCRTWLRANLADDVEYVAANSTAEAARTVAESDDGATAGIANARAGSVYGLEAAGSTSRTTRRTSRASSWWPARVCRHRPATTRPRSSSTSVPTVPGRCSPSSRSSRHARST